MDIKKYMNELGRQARAAARELNRADSGQKNNALLAIADAIESSRGDLLAANKKDMDSIRKTLVFSADGNCRPYHLSRSSRHDGIRRNASAIP